MEINKAIPNDLIEVLYLQRICSNEILSLGLKNNRFPIPDLSNKNHGIFILRDNMLTVGAISLSEHMNSSYKGINWNNASSRPISIELLIVHPNWQMRGIGEALIQFAEKYARENAYTSIRLDVFGENQYSKSLYQKFDYHQTGEFLTEFQMVPFCCFEKLL